MPKVTEVLCDCCGRDLTTTGNSIDYRLCLANERVHSGGGFVTDMMIYPKIKRDAYFCDISCLRKWMDSEHRIDQSHAYRRWRMSDEDRQKPYRYGNSTVHPIAGLSRA
jgi:hypothetical protein